MSLTTTFAHWFHPRRSNNHRPRLLHPQSFLALAVIISIFTLGIRPIGQLLQEKGAILGFASNITASDVLNQVNAERAKSGLSPLQSNAKLNQAALAKAQNMFDKQYWAHVAPDGTEPWVFFRQAQYRYSVAGENLARDFGGTGDMIQAWMESPTHKANIVNTRYQETGIAVVDGQLLGSETTLVVQLFGTPQTTAAKVPTTKTVATKTATKQEVKGETTTPVVEVAPVEEITLADAGDQQPVAATPEPSVQGTSRFPITSLQAPPLFSPLQLSKAFFLAIICVIISTLVYDMMIMNHSNTVRLVGKNLAHVFLFATIAFLLIFFKGGVIG